MNRRGFLKLLTTILGLSALAAFVYPLFRNLLPVESRAKIQAITIPESQVPLDATKELMIGSTPAILLHTDKGFVAFSRVCTHLGCLVKYNPERHLFICPCHAGMFDLEGNVVSGPPPKPLQKFTVKVEADKLVIG